VPFDNCRSTLDQHLKLPWGKLRAVAVLKILAALTLVSWVGLACIVVFIWFGPRFGQPDAWQGVKVVAILATLPTFAASSLLSSVVVLLALR
jgi:hypothetical protein